MSTAKSNGSPASTPERSFPQDRVRDLAEDVPGDLAALIDTANRAMDPILANRDIWRIELAHSTDVNLAWPPAFEPVDGLSGFLCWCAEEAVDNVLNAMARSRGLPDGAIPVPEDTGAAEFQWVLRVCKRAVEAADVAVRREFSGAGRIDGKRPLEGWLIKKHIELLQRSEGLNVSEAAKRIGVSPAAAYRWLGKRN